MALVQVPDMNFQTIRLGFPSVPVRDVFLPLKQNTHVASYTDYEQMLAQEKTLQAIVVASATTVHAEQAIKAIERGLHVLCEKPISTSPEILRVTLPSQDFRVRGSISVPSSRLTNTVPIRRRRLPQVNPAASQTESHLRFLAAL